MSLDIEVKKRKLRLISGSAETVDSQVNELLDDYTAISFVYNAVGDRLVVTAYLVLTSEIRKMQLANIMPPNSRPH